MPPLAQGRREYRAQAVQFGPSATASARAAKQLKRYEGGTVNLASGSTITVIGGTGIEGSFNYSYNGTQYNVTYTNASSGIILYDFTPLKASTPQSVPAAEAEPRKRKRGRPAAVVAGAAGAAAVGFATCIIGGCGRSGSLEYSLR